MSPSERASARRVQDLLNEFVQAAPAKEVEIANAEGEFETKRVKMLTVKKFNPEPNTDAEDSAIIDGLQAGASGETGNELYFGLAVQSLDQNEAIPFIPARPETLLEYDLSRAISTVHGGKAKKIVMMTSMPVSGGFGGNFQAPPQQPWMLYEQLVRDYEVEVIPTSATEIPEDTTTLIVIHPYDITDDGQFAIEPWRSSNRRCRACHHKEDPLRPQISISSSNPGAWLTMRTESLRTSASVPKSSEEVIFLRRFSPWNDRH